MAAIYPVDRLVQWNYPLLKLKLKVSWLSQSSVFFERRYQLDHNIARHLSQSVGLKNKQQFLTTKAIIKQTGFLYGWIRKCIRNVVCVPQPHTFKSCTSTNARGGNVLCFSRKQDQQKHIREVYTFVIDWYRKYLSTIMVSKTCCVL